jgi:hypothetical protein
MIKNLKTAFLNSAKLSGYVGHRLTAEGIEKLNEQKVFFKTVFSKKNLSTRV